MKKVMVVGLLLGLCTYGMGGEYNLYGETDVLPVYYSQITSDEHQETQIDLDQFVERAKTLSKAEKILLLKTELNETKSTLNYYYRSSDFSFVGLLFTVTAFPALVFKIASYAQAYSICDTIKANGGACDRVNHPIDPCDPQLSSMLVAPIICKMNTTADVCAYISLVTYIGVMAYLFYRHCSGPQLKKKHAFD